MIAGLYLKGFIPASFCGISEITYTPKSLLQIIIGTNGSGKSSLLRALSLVPLDRKEFIPGGERKLEVHLNGKIYRLNSKYKSNGAHHEFWMDDENLNPGGTSTVQKELTESHFGYTAFHHKLLTGRLSFTDMSPNARKDLLVMISGLELDYALELFDKVRTAHRDTVGALKHLAGKYSDAAKQLAAMESTEELEDKAKKISQEITELVPKTNYSVNTKETEQKLRDLCENISRMYSVYNQLRQRLLKLAPDFKLRDGTRLESKEVISHYVSASETRLLDVEQTIKTNLEEHSKLEEQTAKFANVPENTNKAQLEAEIAALMDKASKFSSTCQDVGDLSGYLNELMNAHSFLLNYMEIFPETPTFFNNDALKETGRLFHELQASMTKERDAISAITTKIVHAEAAREGNIQCTNCGTEILASGALSEERLKLLRGEMSQHEQNFNALQKQFEDVSEVKEKQDYFIKALAHVREMASKFPLARNIFGADGPGKVLSAPRETLNLIHKEIENVKRNIQYKEIMREIEEKRLVLSLVEVSGREKLFERFKEVEKELDSLYSLRENIKKETENYALIREIYYKMDSLFELLENKYEPEYISLCQQLVKGLADEEVNAFVHAKQSRLADMNKIINDYRLVTNKLKEIKEEETQLAERKQDLELLMHCLSSKKGIVGQQLHTVIAKISDAINEIIEEVWEKELKLKIPEFGKSLDFQFMTQIEGLGGPDIKDLSDGQKEIVNFAMTLVIMRQLDLTDFPLLLDETSKAMDPLHRGTFMNYIRELIDVGEFKSIFLVSHYASEYGGFTNADLVVMNPDNVGIPSGTYNENIVLN